MAICPEMFDARVVSVCSGMNGAKEIRVMGYDVSTYTLEEDEFEIGEVFLRVEPREGFDRDDPAIVRFEALLLKKVGDRASRSVGIGEMAWFLHSGGVRS